MKYAEDTLIPSYDSLITGLKYQIQQQDTLISFHRLRGDQFKNLITKYQLTIGEQNTTIKNQNIDLKIARNRNTGKSLVLSGIIAVIIVKLFL